MRAIAGMARSYRETLQPALIAEAAARLRGQGLGAPVAPAKAVTP